MNHLEKLFFYLNPMSGNGKTGPIATLKTSANTCPDSCAWKKDGCYAKYGPITIHWRKINDVGVQLMTVCRQIRRLSRDEMLRLFEAGDCPGDGKYNLYKDACIKLATACSRLVAFGYSHYRPNKHNLPIFQEMNEHCTINLSADSLEQADELFKSGLPVATIIPKGAPASFYTEGGNKVVRCPFEQVIERDEKGKPSRRKVKNCMSCGKGSRKGPLCSWKNRDFMIGFSAHGSGAKYLNNGMGEYEFVEVEVT